MIQRLLIGINLFIQVYNQNLVVDNLIKELSLYKFKNQDQELTIWIRFQTFFINHYNLQQQNPFALINTPTGNEQIIIMYQYIKQLEIILNIPSLEFSEKIMQVSNYDNQTWLCIQLFKDHQFKYVQMNNKTIILSEKKKQMDQYYGSLITWSNLTFSLKGYVGKQESVYSDIFYLKNDPIVGFDKQRIMNYKQQIAVEMFLRQKQANENIILTINNFEYEYQLIYGFSTVSVKINSEFKWYQCETKQFTDVNHNQWFKYIVILETNQILTQIHTFQNEFKIVNEFQNYANENAPEYFGFIIYFESRSAEIDNIVITNRFNNQNQINNCFPGCKKCIKMDCLECEPNLNISNQCSCEQNHFYNYSMQSCQDISKYEGIIQNEQEVEICELYEYFNDKEQKCMKCPRIDQYYCTDCVVNTEQWKLNYTCTFQEIYTNVFLTYFGLYKNTYQIVFDQDYQQITSEKCEFLSENGLIICEQYDWDNKNRLLCKLYNTLLKRCIVERGVLQKFQNFLFCKLGYAQINLQCFKCPQNCLVCQFIKKKIQCLITMDGFYIVSDNSLIKSCTNGIVHCKNSSQIKESNQDLLQNCQIKYQSICLYCSENYILNEKLVCIEGEVISIQFNFEFSSTQFNQLSQSQLMQIVENQNLQINQQTFSQILYYGRQYENIKRNQIIQYQSNDSFCLKHMNFNQTQKCTSFKINFTSIEDSEKIFYCPNKKCTYNLTLNVIIYISNIQIIVHENKSYQSIQILIDSMNVQLYLSELVFIAEVYVFDSFDQQCQNFDAFSFDEQLKKQFYPNTIFKLVLIYQTISIYPFCQTLHFYSNFQYIEIRNLDTDDNLLIQLDSDVVKFINCRFFNSQKIFIDASYVLFESTSFLDSYVSNTFIEITNENYVQEIQFISCNFINIFIKKESIFININSNVQKLFINNLTIQSVSLNNSQFIKADFINILQIDILDIIDFFSINGKFLIQSQILHENSSAILIDIQIVNTSFWNSVFQEISHQTEVQNFKLINCEFYDSQILNINNRVILSNSLFSQIKLDNSSIFLFIDQTQFMVLRNIVIFDSYFNSTSSFISIEAYSIHLEQILIENCSYSPPTNLIHIKAKLGAIKYVTLKDLTHIYQLVRMLPIYLLNFQIRNIQVSQVYFFQIQIDYVHLLQILSDMARLNDLILKNFELKGQSLNDMIRLSLLDSYSFLIIQKLQIFNIKIFWEYGTYLINIQGNGGVQQISQIIIRNVQSTSSHYIFYCTRNNLKLNNINSQFKYYVGFINIVQSRIAVTEYYQQQDPKSYQYYIPLFVKYELTDNSLLSIFNSSFIHLSQAIVLQLNIGRDHCILKNISIINHKAKQYIFQFSVSTTCNSCVNNIIVSNILVQDTFFDNTVYLFECTLCNIIISQIYFLNTNMMVLFQSYCFSIVINNIYLKNGIIKNQQYLFKYQNHISEFTVYNMYMQNYSSQGRIILFDLFFNDTEAKVWSINIKNVYLDKCNKLNSIIQIQSKQVVMLRINNIIITSSTFKQELIKVDYIYYIMVVIENMFIYNSYLLRLANASYHKLWNFNSICLINLIFDEEISSQQIQFSNSYIQNVTFNGSQIAIINQSLVLHQNQKLLLQPICLSFNEQYIFNSIQIRENVYQVYFNKNQTFVYVPTGIPLSKFIYINPKTKQQENTYENFIIIVNLFKNQQTQCSLNQSIDEIQGNFSNINEFNLKYGINIIDNFTFYMNPYLNYTYIQNDIICNNITLRFNIRTLPCQLGEYLYQNQCLICDISKNYYSVTRKAQFCQIIDNSRVKQLKVGNIQILPGFWRAKEDSNQIEQCLNELCQGGWTQGDDSCVKGYVGALCRECDIYNKRGQGRYAVQDDGCQICEVNYEIAIKGILISIWLVFLGYLSYNTNKQLTLQYLFFKISKRNVADILMRQSTNQISIIFKIFTNYIFFLYLLKDKLDFINYQVNISFAFISNPNSQLKPQLDCLLVEYHQLGIHYIQLIISIISPFYTLSFLYLIYLVLLRFKVIKFQFNLVLITIYSVYLFNQQIIFQNQIQLLSYTTASSIQWINLNQQFQFDTKLHHHMMYYYILPSTLILILIPGVIFIILKTINKRSIKSTKYFGTLFTEYKSNSYYWEIVRIYQKYLIIGFLYVFNKNMIFYSIQSYLAIMIIFQPYALRNLNYLEQKSYFILISLINILIYNDSSNYFRAIVFSIFNLILIYDVITNLIQKGLRQNRNLIIKIQLFLLQKFPISNRWIKKEKIDKLNYNLDVLRNFYKKQKKIILIHRNRQKTNTDFEKFQTEIEMTNINK